MKYTYDPLVDVMSIRLRNGRIAETKEITPSIMIDVDKRGHLLAIEILGVKRQIKRGMLFSPQFSITPYSKRRIRELVIK